MIYRIIQHGYVISATNMYVVLLFQFVILLDELGTYDTKLLCVVEVDRDIYFSLVRSDFSSLNLFGTEVLVFITHASSFELFV
jgi:hypothetical protein